MPYIDTYARHRVHLCPQEGEDYAAFMARCVPAIMQLEPNILPEDVNQMCETAWAEHILKTASEATITIKREYNSYTDGPYIEGWYDDWRVTEIHSATLPQIGIQYTQLAKARAGTGDRFQIAKSVEDEQLVFGWANVAIDTDGTYPLDWDGDVHEPEELEKAAYNFVLKYRATGENHEGEAKGNLVESMMFTKEKQNALGIPEGVVPEAWWVGFHVPDKEVFAKIKSGEYEMFSVQGSAIRQDTGK